MEKQPLSPNPAPSNPVGDLPSSVGVGRALIGMVLIVAGLAVLIASLILRDGNLTGRMPTFPYAGLVTKILGAVVMITGMCLLGKGGMVKFGIALLLGGAAAYFGNVIVNHEFGGPANGLGGLAVLLGLVLVAIAKGWIGQEEG